MVAYEPKRFEDSSLSVVFQRIHEAGKTAIIVTHFDHIGEISIDAQRESRSLRAQDVQFLNQSVLLPKAKDDLEILAAIFAKCHQIGKLRATLTNASAASTKHSSTSCPIFRERSKSSTWETMAACICDIIRTSLPKRSATSFPGGTSRVLAGWTICPRDKIEGRATLITDLERVEDKSSASMRQRHGATGCFPLAAGTGLVFLIAGVNTIDAAVPRRAHIALRPAHSR